MAMKWYFAARMERMELVKTWISRLEKKGHSIAYDWTSIENIRPYLENREKTAQVADQITKSIPDCDVFVLLSDAAGTDMFVELGIALASPKKPRIYAVGKHNKRSLMHLHPEIIHADSMKEVFNKECPEVLD